MNLTIIMHNLYLDFLFRDQTNSTAGGCLPWKSQIHNRPRLDSRHPIGPPSLRGVIFECRDRSNPWREIPPTPPHNIVFKKNKNKINFLSKSCYRIQSELRNEDCGESMWEAFMPCAYMFLLNKIDFCNLYLNF